MTTQKLPGTEAARHGTGDADLTIMIGAHDALRRDLVSLARTASVANLADPVKARSVTAGWTVFKRQLHLHHSAEDELIWPALRARLGASENALSVLAEMEAEHQLIDPLLAAVDEAFAGQPADDAGQPADEDGGLQGADRLADVIDALTGTLTGHLAHEERDGLPLIGATLTAAEWRGVGFKIARQNGLSGGAELFSWMADGIAPDQARKLVGQLPPPARVLYRAVWKPRFSKTPRW
jgi:hypothetical protein